MSLDKFNPRDLAPQEMARFGYQLACDHLHSFLKADDPDGFLRARDRWSQARAVLGAAEGRAASDRIDAANRRPESFGERTSNPETGSSCRFLEWEHGKELHYTLWNSASRA